jgi:putative PIN family toxin of toxin-antitoxin system
VVLTVVFDTNILFSATGWRGSPFQCVEQARAGKIEAVTCIELMEELAEKLELKLGFSPEQSAETLADYLSFLRVISIPKTLNAVPRDPDDNAVLECALEGNAKYVVSGDTDLLELKNFRGIEIVRASEFLTILTKQENQRI